ncbi:MAG: recombinase family protein [Acidimicrobiales bacterium]|jgi:DNA invertase Pin-like site-specific DNA recombinase
MTTSDARVRALGYVRVSTTDQAERGQGLNIQRRGIREYCRAHRFVLLEILGDEGISGASGLQCRPGLAEALSRIENHEATVLVLYRLDRLARDLLLQETVVERLRLGGGSVISVSEPDVDSNESIRILIRQVLGALSQYEKTLLKARMAAGRKLKAERGGYTGGVPRFGYSALRHEYVPLEREQKIVARIRVERADGASFQTIADGLNADGLGRLGGGEHHQEFSNGISGRE